MQVLAGIAGALLIIAMLAEFFVAFMLPRRVRRDPQIARGIYGLLWRPWRAAAALLSPSAEDTMLGFFGPLALLIELVVWVLGIMLGFALLQWAFGSQLGTGTHHFADDLYFSSGEFLSAAVSTAPIGGAAKALSLAEAASGVFVIFIVIGYLPSIYFAFSRREVAVSQLASRAGTPPTALHLLRRISERGRWEQLRDYLGEAEGWVAEMMETHLSYPLLAYYRSQHVNQNWLSALTTVVDTSAAIIAALPDGEPGVAEQTYAIGRHALSDLAHQFHARPAAANRLTDEAFDAIWAALESHPLRDMSTERETVRRRLDHLRNTYEANAIGLSVALALPLPAWAPSEQRPRAPRPSRLRATA
jgi:hypothetical protein